ncbi:MAG: outer membrane beta-barrel protein [Bacteroidales bacterium]|jgi:hypothetical protein|nr:outer membrane beta-barrel protein [Bacteroidales bacterium]
MKKTLTTLALLGGIAIGTAFAQNEDVNRISFGLKGGYNYLLLSDRTQYDANCKPAFGAFFEVTANPLWSAGLEYLYLGNDQDAKSGDNLKSSINALTYYNSINITNLVAKNRRGDWQYFSVFGTLGAGLGFYSSQLGDADKKTGVQPTVMAALSAEYNFSDWFALGVESQFRANPDVQFLPNEYTGTANHCGLNLTARFKLGREKQNVRNMSWQAFNPCPIGIADNATALNMQEQQYSQLQNKIAAQKESIQTLQSQVQSLQTAINQQ